MTPRRLADNDTTPMEHTISFFVALGLLVTVAVGYHSTERNFGRDRFFHVMYWAIMFTCGGFISYFSFGKYVFSGLSYTIIGAWFPIYESIRAICTVSETDDKAWLQYWMVGGLVFILTAWVDDIFSAKVDVYWHAFLFIFLLWLYFPKTDGAKLIYENLTKPYLAPKLRPYASKMDDMIQNLYSMLMNVAHLWVVGLFFVFLPQGLKRIVAVGVGTAYPFVSSVGAAVSEEIEDDTYWLTYWSCYGILFIVMDILENWIGWLPGFYALFICAAVYLMLPMFDGANKVFRKVLVPLAGLKEMLLLRDAVMVKKKMLRDLDPERAESVRKAIAKFYQNSDDKHDPEKIKEELYSGYSDVKIVPIPVIKMPEALKSFKLPSFSKAKGDDATTPANETTNLVV